LKKVETSLAGVWEIRTKQLRDSRGFFLETYHREKFAELGITDTFVQDNHSCSRKGVVRGLHYQLQQAQAKLVRVVEGDALDVAVDIRQGSPQFGKWTSVVLSSEAQNQLYTPAGFAHGFLAVSENVQLLYRCSDLYSAGDEHGILWNDPGLGIAWNVANPILSEKDAKLPTLASMAKEWLPRYPAK
jgi:dTDP-4-dehydrorhamnose 3,5-epimerase